LDKLCDEIGRDPALIIRSTALSVSYERPADTRATVVEALDAGFHHIVLVLPAPYPEHVAHWVAEEVAREFVSPG
jgi:hypothetical protein